MKIRRLFLGAALLLGMATTATTAKAEEVSPYTFEQNFDYNAAYQESIEQTQVKNSYNVTINTGANGGAAYTVGTYKMQKDEDGTEYLRYSLPAYSTNENSISTTVDATINIRAKSSADLFNSANDSAIIKVRFRTNNTYRKSIRLYMPAADVDLASGSFSAYLLNMKGDQVQYNINGSTKTSTYPGIVANTWYEMTTIIEEKGNGTDVFHTYLNGVHLYSEQIKSGVNWKGELYDINFYTHKAEGFLQQDWDIDYVKVGKFDFAEEETKASLSVDYANLEATNVDLRFGGIISETSYFAGAEYGVVVLPSADASTLTSLNVTTLNELKTAGKVVACTPAKVSGGYQYAWVIDNVEGHYDVELTAVMYMLVGDTVVLSQTKTASVNSVVSEYVERAAEFDITGDILTVLEKLNA